MMEFHNEINVQSANGKSLLDALKCANVKLPSFLKGKASREIGRLEGCREALTRVVDGDEDAVLEGPKRKQNRKRKRNR